jgi:exodeoxyribonuclease-3
VNWIRAVLKKNFLDFLKESNADVFCIQETKAFENQLEENFLKDFWYNSVWHKWEKPWYAWTATFSKKVSDKSFSKFDCIKFYEHWRMIRTDFWNIVILNCYFPNWWTKANWEEMLTYKLSFYDEIIKYTTDLRKEWKSIIILWDLNICHKEIDIARPKENVNSIWFLQIERNKMTELLNSWFIDAFRFKNPELKDKYTWWSYRAWARPRNVGWRIDYFFISDDLKDKIKNVEQLDQILWSDHCPILLELDL